MRNHTFCAKSWLDQVVLADEPVREVATRADLSTVLCTLRAASWRAALAVTFAVIGAVVTFLASPETGLPCTETTWPCLVTFHLQAVAEHGHAPDLLAPVEVVDADEVGVVALEAERLEVGPSQAEDVEVAAHEVHRDLLRRLGRATAQVAADLRELPRRLGERVDLDVRRGAEAPEVARLRVSAVGQHRVLGARQRVARQRACVEVAGGSLVGVRGGFAAGGLSGLAMGGGLAWQTQQGDCDDGAADGSRRQRLVPDRSHRLVSFTG